MSTVFRGPRYRYRGALSAVGNDLVTTVSNCSSPPTSQVVNGGMVRTGVVESTVDWLSPDYFKRRKRGEWLGTNPFYHTKTEASFSGASDTTFTNTVTCSNHKVYWYTIVGPYHAWIKRTYFADPITVADIMAPDVRANLYHEAATGVLAKRTGSSESLAESAAEIDKTFAMVHQPLDAVNEFLAGVYKSASSRSRTGKVVGAAKAVVKLPAALWLQYRYGLKPLLSDVKNAMKSLSREYRKEAQPVLKRYISFAQANALNGSVADASDGWLHYKENKRTSNEMIVKAIWYDRVKPNFWHDIGLNPANVAGLAWELLPYSFVVDWFTNIGDVIYANMPRVGVESLGGTFVILDTREFWSTPSEAYGSDPNWHLSGGPSDTIHLKITEKRRTTISETASLVVRSDFRLDNWTRALDAAALSTTLLRLIRW